MANGSKKLGDAAKVPATAFSAARVFRNRIALWQEQNPRHAEETLEEWQARAQIDGSVLNAYKALKHGVDPNAWLLHTLLAGNNTYGFDVESAFRTREGFVLVELLRATEMPPERSHPNLYSWNYRKFVNLLSLAGAANGKLYLINYNDEMERFRLFEMLEIHVNENGRQATFTTNDVLCGSVAAKTKTGIAYTRAERVITQDEIIRWYRDQNQSARNQP